MSFFKNNFAASVLCAAVLSVFSTGCGKSMVTGVTVTSTQQSGDQVAQLDIQFLTNGLVLPSISLPIANPENPSTSYGSLQLDQLSSTTGEVKVDVDLTTAAKLPSGPADLPNGTPVPVVESGQVQVLSIPIPTTRFVLYLAVQINALQPGQSPVAMVGLALPFTQLDAVGGVVGNADLFIPFGVDGVTGSAGIFGGKTSGTSGIGIFVDVSGLIPQAPVATPNIVAQSPGVAAEASIVSTMARLGAERTRLTLE